MSSKPRSILIVEADDAARQRLAAVVQPDFRVVRATSGEAALQSIVHEEVDLALINVSLPGISGLELLRIVRENYPLTECIMLSAVGELETAVQAIKDGAYHFVTFDVGAEALRSVLRTASERQDLNRQVMALTAEVAESEREFVVGPSPAMQQIVDLVNRVARLSATVLILGESGTGKELIARLIHRHSARPQSPFVAVNLAAIPRELVESTLFGHEKGAFTGAMRQQIGKFEMAGDGTLFLDEIGDLGLDLQAKLLRAIQEGEIERVGGAKPIKTEFRLIAATNTDLEKAVKEGRFREDLFYRLNVIPIKVPPLRDRMDDVPVLADFFLRKFSGKFRKPIIGITDQTMKILSSYWWPGNIRELQNLVERLVAMSDKEWITEEDLPIEYYLVQPEPDSERTTSLLTDACETFERNFILKALERTGWNVTATARYLGVPLSTMKHKMERLEIRQLAKKLRGT
ncbi:MAG: sigma-54-dependent transcriptional regulator [Bacteroidales bacterium]